MLFASVLTNLFLDTHAQARELRHMTFEDTLKPTRIFECELLLSPQYGTPSNTLTAISSPILLW